MRLKLLKPYAAAGGKVSHNPSASPVISFCSRSCSTWSAPRRTLPLETKSSRRSTSNHQEYSASRWCNLECSWRINSTCFWWPCWASPRQTWHSRKWSHISGMPNARTTIADQCRKIESSRKSAADRESSRTGFRLGLLLGARRYVSTCWRQDNRADSNIPKQFSPRSNNVNVIVDCCCSSLSQW